ncbi:MAG: SprT-like domain-containing protein [Planctomycetota bacterium]
MARRRTSFRTEKDSGQLFLFPERPPVAGPPDLDTVFADLNERFFEGRLSARLEWSNRLTSSAGSCRPDDRLIRVSRLYWRRQPDSLPTTIAHEMIHLVTPNHGPEFRRIGRPIAAALGVDWNEFRYATRWADLSRYRYVYACPNCGLELPSKKRRRASCGKCNPAGYDERFRLTLTESRAKPGPVLRGERPVRAS